MENDIDNILKSLRHEALTDAEMRHIRSRLLLFMREHPAHASVRLRMYARMLAVRASIANVLSGRHTYAYRFAVLVLVFVCAGGGTSFAAETSLPGDLLYPIKVHLNEQVMAAMARNPVAKADWNTEIATRRLEEAEALAAQGKLTPVAATDLQTQIEKANQEFHASVNAASESHDAHTTELARNDMQAVLDVHSNVLASLSEKKPDSRDALSGIVAAVDAAAGVADAVAESATSVVVPATLATAPENRGTGRVMAMKANSSNQQRKVAVPTPAIRPMFAKFAAPLNATSANATSTVPLSEAAPVQAAIVAGENDLSRGDYTRAFKNFRAAISSQARQGRENTRGAFGKSLNTNADAITDDDDLGNDAKGGRGENVGGTSVVTASSSKSVEVNPNIHIRD